MDQFPQWLYRHGEEPRLVRGADEHAQALADGWVEQPWEVVAPAEKPAAEPVPDDDAPPTRAELEQKARELGIKFDGRWGDKRLADAIADKLKG